jgi:RecQ family ATP-dependent DNA helicase
MKSSSWDDEPAFARKEGKVQTQRPSVGRLSVSKRKLSNLHFEPSVLPPAPAVENQPPENAAPTVKPWPSKPLVHVNPQVVRDARDMRAPSHAPPQSSSSSLKIQPVPSLPGTSVEVIQVPQVTQPTTQAIAVPEPIRLEPKKRKRPTKFKQETDKSGSSVSANFVFQDLKLKNGTKATKGAEQLRRKIKRARNERWREANGIKARGKRAANQRREQLAKELRHEKNIADATMKLDEMFSKGVDIEAVLVLDRSEMDDSVPKRSVPCIDSDKPQLELFLKNEFEYSGFRPGQFEAIQSVLAHKRSLIILPTGRGKSLTYQFPSVFLRKQHSVTALTIVVSPLIALMTDQLQQLPRCCRGAVIHSNLNPTQASMVHTAIAAGLIDILFVAPERLLMYSITDLVSKNCQVLLVAVDEAHCLSEWSHSFRPAYLALGKVIDEQIKPCSLLALTATATQQTVSSLCSVLSVNSIVRTDGINSPESQGSVQRDNLELFARRSPNPSMDLIEFLLRPEMQSVGPIIVYVQYKWQTENVANVLRERGFGSAEPYHAGLSSKERRDVYERFINNNLRIVVATVAFGMGIDKSNLRAVIHLCVPKSIENYVQETGRCSRDDKQGFCRCFFNADDFTRVRNRAEAEAVKQLGVESVVRRIIAREDMYDDKVMFMPESVELVSSAHMSLILSILEKDARMIEVFQGFPLKLKLRFFNQTIAEIASIDPFVDILFHSPFCGKREQETVIERSGVATIDLPKAVAKSGMTPPHFMHKLSEAARAQKFAIEKSDWGHILFLKEWEETIDSSGVAERVFAKAIATHRLEINRFDASFALMSRIAAETIQEEKIGHKLIQQYFAAEKRIHTGDDLVPSILEGAPPAISKNIVRELVQIRSNSAN